MATFYTLSNEGMKLLKEFEGLSLKAYRDKINGKYDVPTIGYGTIKYPNGKAVKMGDTCTEAQAKEYLEYELNKVMIPNVNKYNKIYGWNHNEFTALVIFAYNIGSIDGLTAKGTRSRAQIRAAWTLYCKFGGKVCKGLQDRRKAELKLFNTSATISETASNVAKEASEKVEKAKSYNPNKTSKFLHTLDKYDIYIGNHNKLFKYKSTPLPTWNDVKNHVKNNKKVDICCVAPCRWALHEIGLGRNSIYSKNGKFVNFKGTPTSHLKRIKSGGPIGLTLKKAVDKGLLKPGDIIGFKGCTHTVVYSGNKYIVYDGGTIAEKKIKYKRIHLDYSAHSYKNKPISQILRWKKPASAPKKYTGAIPKIPSRGYFKKGDKGDDVKKLQRLLAFAGVYSGNIDGILGDKSIHGIKLVQKEYGLKVDGKCGKKTIEVLSKIKR